MNESHRETWFIEQVLPHEGALRGYLGRFLRRSHDIEDVVQDTYARLIALGDEERGRIRQVQAYIFRTARNLAIDRLRRQPIVSLEKMTEIEGLDVIDEGVDGYTEVNARQELGLLRQAIAALPDRCRQVLTLRKVFGLSQKEIAARLAISENTVERHIANGMRACTEYVLRSTSDRSVSQSTPSVGAWPRGVRDVE
jgi:RNA polymerase sigma-70 factor (ECF subfamily)